MNIENKLGRPYRLVIGDTGCAEQLVEPRLLQKMLFVPWKNATAFPHGRIGDSHGSYVKMIACEGWNAPQLRDDVEVHCFQCLDENGCGDEDSIAAAFEYALDLKADGMNLSLGMELGEDTAKDGLNAARRFWPKIDKLGKKLHDEGCLIAVAAGNEDTLTDYRRDNIDAPAIYSWAVAVSATDDFGVKTEWSGDGDANELCADGVKYYGVDWVCGTSFACPLVATVAGHIVTYELGKVDVPTIRMELRKRAVHGGDHPHGVWCRDHGFGSQTPEARRIFAVVGKLRDEVGYHDDIAALFEA